jgi:hypothetical protein
MMTMSHVTANWDGHARALGNYMRLCSRPSLGRQGRVALLLCKGLPRGFIFAFADIHCISGSLMTAEQETILLCDEAQLAFDVEGTNSQHFWNLLKQLEGGRWVLKTRLRVLLAAAYGAGPSGSDADNVQMLLPTPISVNHPDMVVTISPDLTHPSLVMKDLEVAEMWSSFQKETGLALNQSIKTKVFAKSGRQVGFRCSILIVALASIVGTTYDEFEDMCCTVV